MTKSGPTLQRGTKKERTKKHRLQHGSLKCYVLMDLFRLHDQPKWVSTHFTISKWEVHYESISSNTRVHTVLKYMRLVHKNERYSYTGHLVWATMESLLCCIFLWSPLTLSQLNIQTRRCKSWITSGLSFEQRVIPVNVKNLSGGKVKTNLIPVLVTWTTSASCTQSVLCTVIYPLLFKIPPRDTDISTSVDCS